MLWCISSMVKNSISLAQEQMLCICDIILVSRGGRRSKSKRPAGSGACQRPSHQHRLDLENNQNSFA